MIKIDGFFTLVSKQDSAGFAFELYLGGRPVALMTAKPPHHIIKRDALLAISDNPHPRDASGAMNGTGDSQPGPALGHSSFHRRRDERGRHAKPLTEA